MFTTEELREANALFKGTMMENLGIVLEPSGPDTVVATMPVGPKVLQPLGLLHGGATVALAESLGSVGSYMLVDRGKFAIVGIEVNANHLRVVRSGAVKATGTLAHKGRTTHVWDIRVTDDQERLIAICRITNLIIERTS